jgi:ectoine hydroxylase-related dioxygenase (phytanoyl-CoA dioxygenase family)
MTETQILTSGTGWILYKKFVPDSLIDDLNKQLYKLAPRRALDVNKHYAEDKNIANLGPLAIWWSQQVLDWPEVQAIESVVCRYIETVLPGAKLYASDVVTIQPGSTLINPHIDTPHRFPKWNFDNRLLSIQTIIPLHDIGSDSGATGLVSGSQLNDYPIDDCYQGKFDSEFLDKCEQHDMPSGSLLLYNAKLLHSSMPNPSTRARKALLIHYTNPTIYNELREVDNIWSAC